MIKRLFLLASLLFIGSQNIAFSGTVSFDQLATSSDLTVAKYNSDLNTIFQDHNTNIQSSNIAADTVAEVDMADDANPRLRDYELGGSGTECEMVYTGLLTTTTSGTLTGSVPSGTAYPRGYRVVKSSGTSKTFTASRWTFVDIDINGNFTYSEVTIGGATPSVAPNSIRLSRVSTDSTQVNHVQDLRTLSCTSAKFTTVKETSTGATLDNFFSRGQYTRRFSPAGRTPQGFAQGLYVSYDTHTQFKVTAGSAYINGRYRSVSTDFTVTTANDDPANGTSGLDTGSISSGRYYVYAVADQDDVSTLSISYSTSASAPTGVTNYRLIGGIVTDSTNLFTSRDAVTAHAISERELPAAWVSFNGDSGGPIHDAFNVSAVTRNGTGDYTVTFDVDMPDTNYVVQITAADVGTNAAWGYGTWTKAVGSIRFTVHNSAGTATDLDRMNVTVYGNKVS